MCALYLALEKKIREHKQSDSLCEMSLWHVYEQSKQDRDGSCMYCVSECTENTNR